MPVVGQFVLLALAWGSSFLFIKIGLEGLSPLQVVWGRMVFGAGALLLTTWVMRRRVPRDPVLWGHLTVVALLLCLVPFTLFAWAEQHIPSGLASTYNATTPLMAMAWSAALLPAERLTRHGAAGLLLGFVGVLVILDPFGADLGGNLAAQLACLAATACYGVAFVYLRRFVSPRRLPALSVAAVQVTAGAVLMLAATPFLAPAPAIAPTWPVVCAIVALGVFGTGLAYVWNTNVVAAWGAADAAAVTYLTPVVGVTLGVLLLREPVTWPQAAGTVLVVLGILATHRRLPGLRRVTSDAARTAPGGPSPRTWRQGARAESGRHE
ncbi:DMT family transporter [Streptomyces sp. RKND-216]|uniref:DMT family transporter n=1 Tax=Streptomyces sp. RKND-216 TaxID=2562581 RepID=UPI00109DCBCC|nr:DMT family transporter [Streptomyces sp. RKND-216]THA24019.1 DMT family transporter [Streptomyces sp. RKND-216]